MTQKELKKRSALFKSREREHVKTVRYHLNGRNYLAAMQSLAWAFQQATAADEAMMVGNLIAREES